MRKVLFVDDEAQALEALRDSLRPRRRQWEMAFRVGAQAALEELAGGDYDVVVSDLSMPGIDGVALLERVRELRPGAVRVLLSGSVELDVIARSTSVAHRLLAKPCDAAEPTTTSHSSAPCARAPSPPITSSAWASPIDCRSGTSSPRARPQRSTPDLDSDIAGFTPRAEAWASLRRPSRELRSGDGRVRVGRDGGVAGRDALS